MVMGRPYGTDAGSTFEGNPCRHGHGTKRYRTSGGCVTCTKMRSLEARQRKALRKAHAAVG